MENTNLTNVTAGQAIEVNENSVQQLRVQLRQDPQVRAMASQIDVRDSLALLNYGEKSATEISASTDKILNGMSLASIQDSNKLGKALTKVMDKVDVKELEGGKPGGLKGLFYNLEKAIQKQMEKYQTVGGEIEVVYQEMKKYEKSLESSLNMYDQIQQDNQNYYVLLQKEIVAGELKIDEIKNELIPALEQKVAQNDQMAQIELEKVQSNLRAFENRLFALETAQMAAFNNAIQLKVDKDSDMDLLASVKESFITTIPIFKQGMIKAVQAKKRDIAAQGLQQVRQRTNEMLVRNAQITADQSRKIAEMANTPGLEVQAVEEAMRIMSQGIRDVAAINETKAKEREAGKQKLLQMQDNFKKEFIDKRN